jgi:hypothetical protein
MATSSNDIYTPPVFAAQIDRTMNIVGPNRTVVWVNIQVARVKQTTAIQLADQRNGAWINLQLVDAQKKYPNLRIVRWAENLAAKPSRLTMYLRDGVHTSVPYGQDARNELIVQTLAAARGRTDGRRTTQSSRTNSTTRSACQTTCGGSWSPPLPPSNSRRR